MMNGFGQHILSLYMLMNYGVLADINQYEVDVNTTHADIPINVSRKYMDTWNEVKYDRNIKKKDIFRHIFINMMNGYNKALSPAIGTNKEFQIISLGIESMALVEINEVEDRMSTIMKFACLWADDRLIYKPKYKGEVELSPLGVPLDEDIVWKPDLQITNPHDTRRSSNKDRISSSIFLYTYPEGLLVWRFTKAIETRCKIDTRYYPFDRQVCYVELSFNMPYFMLALKLQHSINTEEFKNGNWKCIHQSVYQYIDVVDLFIHARIKFVFDRNPMRPAFIFILPLFVLVLLTPLVFLVPADTNDRVGLVLTVLLATSVYMSLVADKLPDTSDPFPIIIIVFFLWYIYSALIVALVLLNLKVYHKSETSMIPVCLQRLFSFTSRVCCTKRNMEHASVGKKRLSMPIDGDDLELDKHCKNKVMDITWRQVSKAFDKFLLVTMLGLKITFDVAIFIVLYTGDGNKTGEENITDWNIKEYVYDSRDSLLPGGW